MAYWTEKVILITGGSAGLGLAIARQSLQAGAKVVIAARDAEKLASAAAELGREGQGAIECVAADITQQTEVDALIAKAVERFGRLDALVNCAGKSSRGSAIETTPEQFQQLWELNFLATVRCTQAAMPHMLAARGHLVNIGSLASKSAAKHLGAYPARKFPVAAYSQQLRLELGEQGLHVLLVCPGPIRRTDGGNRYDQEAANLPEAARQPGGGVKLKGIDPDELARRILRACERRQLELVVPAKSRILFALAQLWPTAGDWLLKRMTGG
jgi:short-subunit dehydrogenase